MKISILNKLSVGLALMGACAFTSCESGLTYMDVPESVYTETRVSTYTVKARELFEDKIYGVNWNQWVPDYISTVVIGGSSELTWVNKTGQNYTLVDGTVVAPDEEVKLKGQIIEENNNEAPDGKLYVMQTYALSKVTYSTPNKGFVFDASKFSGDFELINPDENGRSQQVKLPVRPNEIIVEFSLVDANACDVEPVDNAPKLGVPGDFTTPRRYLVKNITRRPGGVPQAQRLYEVRVTFLPQ